MRRWLLLACLIPAATVAAERTVLYDKSEVAFTVTQMGVGVSGKFTRFSAHIDLDAARPEQARAAVEVETSSISTGDDEADAEAVKKPWLDAAGFPRAQFTSKTIRALGGGKYEATGTLSLKGRPRELKVPFELKANADGSAVITGGFTLTRTDFGIGGGEWNQDDVVASKVPVTFRLTLAAAR